MIDTGLSGRVVLVTGGAGGIGAAISRAFAAEGAHVVIHHLAARPAAPDGVSWEHMLVNNAAHCESPDTIGTQTAAGLERHYRVNAVAPALLTTELARRAGGTSKGALEALTRATALDLGPAGIRVNAVAPGPVQTGWMTDELVEQVRQVVPLGRPGDPVDIADAVIFLASHQARWITGQVLQVAGGHAL
jgi:3-oxoacyl-[acyl-carrier protein] reductase